VVKNTQTLMRFIWFHVPLRLTPKTSEESAKPEAPPRSKEEMERVMTEKRAALDLLEGYVTSCEIIGPSILIAPRAHAAQVCIRAETSSPGYESWTRLARDLDSWVLPTGELGIFYADLYHLVKPLHEVIHLPLLLVFPPFVPDHRPASKASSCARHR